MLSFISGCRKFTILLFFVTVVYSCKQSQTVENPFYRPYFQRIDSNYQHIMSGVLDTLTFLFKKEPPGLKDQARLYEYKASLYKNIGSFDSSFLLLDSLKTFLDDHKTAPFYKDMYAAMLLSVVDNYTRLKQYDPAMNALLTAKQFIETNVTSGCLSVQYSSIGNMLMEQGRKRLAATYFVKSYKDAESCVVDPFNRFYQVYGSLSAAAYCYMEATVYDSAQYYYDAAMNYVTDNGSRFPDKASYVTLCKAIISGNRAILEKILGQYNKAEQSLLFAIDATTLPYPVYANSCKLDLGDLYLRVGKLNGVKLIIDSLDSIKKSGALMLADQNYKLDLLKKGYYSRTGDYKNAFVFYDSAFQYKDSLELANRLNIARDAGLEFEKRGQIAANELLKAQYGRRSFQLITALLLIVLVLIITGFVWFHLKRTARQARLLEYLNHEIHLKNTDIADAYASLESSYEANKSILRTVAHDLKNPIVGIANLAKFLQKDTSIKPDAKENLGHIAMAATTATNLINSLLNKKEKKYEEIEKEVNDMMELLKHCTELMKPKAQQKKQKLVLGGVHASAVINKNEMWRVITNIINNAIKFSPENTSINIDLQKQDLKLLLSIKDEGIGIPEPMLKDLFTAGPEIQRTGTAGEPSYGLGLKISKRIVEEHEGQLRVESVEGEGTTFYIILPAA
ncbi:MAG: ATP-binding protein [Agriterribacter sp.]